MLLGTDPEFDQTLVLFMFSSAGPPASSSSSWTSSPRFLLGYTTEVRSYKPPHTFLGLPEYKTLHTQTRKVELYVIQLQL